MEKTSEKSFPIFQPRMQMVVKSLQDLLIPHPLVDQVRLTLRAWPFWVYIQQFAQKSYYRRLPAVITAAIFLAFFFNVSGIGQVELVLASFVSVAGLSCFILMEGFR